MQTEEPKMKIARQRLVWSELRLDASMISQMASVNLERMIAESAPDGIEDLAAKALIAYTTLGEAIPMGEVAISLKLEALEILRQAGLSNLCNSKRTRR